MSTFDDDLRARLAARAGKIQAPPDLVERVVRRSRRRVNRVRLTALAAAVTVAGTVAPAYLVLRPDPVPAASAVAGPTPETGAPDQAQVESPTPSPSMWPPSEREERNLGDLGDGRAFGHVRVGYLPDGLKWSNWSVDFGDHYATTWNEVDEKGDGAYSVEIYVYEGRAVAQQDQYWENRSKAEKIPFGDRSGYVLRQWVEEDNAGGTPTLFMRLGDERRVEIMLSPTYAKKVGTAKAIVRLLKKIASGLTTGEERVGSPSPTPSPS